VREVRIAVGAGDTRGDILFLAELCELGMGMGKEVYVIPRWEVCFQWIDSLGFLDLHIIFLRVRTLDNDRKSPSI
jgi:hypothetical protein